MTGGAGAWSVSGFTLMEAVEVEEVVAALNERGFIASKYYGDGIHCNALAYNDVFFPVVSKYIRGGK